MAEMFSLLTNLLCGEFELQDLYEEKIRPLKRTQSFGASSLS